MQSKANLYNEQLELATLATLLSASTPMETRRHLWGKLALELFTPRGVGQQIYRYAKTHVQRTRRLPDVVGMSSDPTIAKSLRDALQALLSHPYTEPSQVADALTSLTTYAAKRTLHAGFERVTKLVTSDAYDEQAALDIIRSIQRSIARPAGMSEVKLTPRDPRLRREVALLLAQAQDVQRKRWATGWTTLDKIMSGGLGPQELMIMAANTGGGKSMAALAMAMRMAQEGADVLYFSFEMRKQSVALRLLSREAGYTRGELASGTLRPEQLAAAGEQFATYYDQYAGSLRFLTPDQGFARPDLDYLESVITRDKTDIVFVDYMGMLSGPPGGRSSEEERLRNAAADLVMLAAATDTGVVAMAQLNDEGEVKYSKGIKDAATIALTWDSRKAEPSVDQRGDIKNNVYRINIIKKREQAGECPDYFYVKQEYDNLRIEETDAPTALTRNAVADTWRGGVGGLGRESGY